MINGERRVVGVVGNVRHQALEREGGLEAYLLITQVGNDSVELVVRTRMDVDRAVSPRRFLVFLPGGFAAAALLLASVGIFGVVSYVTQRTAEIGIRMALGASAGLVQREVLGRTANLVAAGVTLGIGGALVLGRLTASLLFQLTPTDPVTFATTVTVLLIVAVAAGYLPARRASRIDPMSTLRTDQFTPSGL